MSKTPKLRFKEFSGDWEVKKLGDLADICTGKKDTQDKVDDGIYPFFVRSQTIERINSYSFDGEAILTAGDGVGVGKVFHYLNEKFDYHQRVYKLSDFKEGTNGRYIYEYFKKNFIREVTKYTAKTSVDSVRMEMITKMDIPHPSIEEQEKIAVFFSLIDDKISLQGEKVEALKDYKKGMMQKIFSRELRFKDDDGRDYPEWKAKKLGECIDTITDYVAAGSFATIRENVQYKNEKDYAQLIRTVDLKSNFKNSDNFVYVDKNAFEFLYRVNLDRDSIILPNVGNIGEVYFVKSENLPNENNVLAPNSILLRSSKNYNLFLYQLFNTKKFRGSLDIITSKSGQPKFNKTELKEIRLNIPTEQEQVKIAKFLEGIDLKIDKEQEKLDYLNEYKKGLLQQMFV